MPLQAVVASGLTACSGQPCLTNIHQIQIVLQEFNEHHANAAQPPPAGFDTDILQRMAQEASDALLAMQPLSPNSEFKDFIEELGACGAKGKTPCPAKTLNPPKAIVTEPCKTVACCQDQCPSTAQTLSYICAAYAAVCTPCAGLCLLTVAQQFQQCLANCQTVYGH